MLYPKEDKENRILLYAVSPTTYIFLFVVKTFLCVLRIHFKEVEENALCVFRRICVCHAILSSWRVICKDNYSTLNRPIALFTVQKL